MRHCWKSPPPPPGRENHVFKHFRNRLLTFQTMCSKFISLTCSIPICPCSKYYQTWLSLSVIDLPEVFKLAQHQGSQLDLSPWTLQNASSDQAITFDQHKAAFTRDRIRLKPIRNWYGYALCSHGTWCMRYRSDPLSGTKWIHLQRWSH